MASSPASSTTGSRNEKVVEDTFDWYAQDSGGNVWYLGEDESSAGTAGSRTAPVPSGRSRWRPARRDHAADPVPGLEYRQEYYAGEAEDHAKVLSVDEQTEVAFGHFTGVLLTKDSCRWSRGSGTSWPRSGVGLLLAVTTSGGGEPGKRLLRVERPDGEAAVARQAVRARIVNVMVNDPFRALSPDPPGHS